MSATIKLISINDTVATIQLTDSLGIIHKFSIEADNFYDFLAFVEEAFGEMGFGESSL